MPPRTRSTEVKAAAVDTQHFSGPIEYILGTIQGIRVIKPGSSLPGLSSSELSILRKKQASLSRITFPILEAPHLNALNATLIFAQHEAGTAVCIDEKGWVLTCAHCFGDTEDERNENNQKWLLFNSGIAVQVECRVWNAGCDLALLKIIAIECDIPAEHIPTFAHVPIASTPPRPKAAIMCIGQPGKDDLESATNRRTKYNLIEVSEGNLQGMVKGADPHDNSEIGTLKHNAWTYWGHSGAPLIHEADGKLVGLHSSWDDQTAMRHGVPLVAIQQFLREQNEFEICS